MPMVIHSGQSLCPINQRTADESSCLSCSHCGVGLSTETQSSVADPTELGANLSLWCHSEEIQSPESSAYYPTRV